MKRICFIILVLLLVTNCGSLPKYKKDNFKPIKNAKQIEGEFENFNNDSLKLFYNSLNAELNWRKKEIDSTKYASAKITILDKKRMQLDFIIDNEIHKSKTLNYRLRKNGFIKLRNRNFRVSGIPMILGGYEVRKYELGLNQNNDLILHGIDDSAGGIIIILSGGWCVVNNKTYKRIQ